jgi:hypothetical protein
MNSFSDWDDVLAVSAIREAAVAYAAQEAPEYLEESLEGVMVIGEDVYPYVLERAIKDVGECVFYFSSGVDDQVQDHVHYRFAGKYFECDGNGQIGGPYDDNNADVVLDLLSDAYAAGFVASPEPGATVSVGGDFPDDYFVKLCADLIPVGQKIQINSTLYVRTKAVLVAQ